MKDSSFRITTAHTVAIIFLIINAIFFTDNEVSSVIQVIIAFAIALHHADDLKIKNTLINSQNELKEDTNIFNRNVIVTETDLNGVITYVNTNYLKVTGYTEDELIGYTQSMVRSDETSNELYKRLWETLNSNKTFTNVFKNKRKNGAPFWIDSHISPVFLNNKKVGYKAIMFDITDKILTQKNLQHVIEDKELKLKEQAIKFEFAINSSRDGFWDYDLVKKEFYLSKGWKKRLGFNLDETLTYLDYLSLIPEKHRFEHHKVMHDLLDKHSSELKYVHFRVRYPIITKDSEELIIEDVGDILFDNDNNPIRITGFHRDITDHERQAKIIATQNRVAALGEMMANIAHQWRQPIGAINNTLNDIEFEIELDELKHIDTKKVLEISNKIKEYTKHLNQTIDDFRKLTSDDKVKTTFIVKESIEQAYKIAQMEYEKNNINFKLIESSESVCELNGYNRELQQVIINILNNAKDILIEKKITNPIVTVSLIGRAKDITIMIHDNGGGIAENIIPKIFDPYFTTKHKSIGTGIGLYMSKKIITEYFQGTLEVKNENQGAKFSITLPKEVDLE